MTEDLKDLVSSLFEKEIASLDADLAEAMRDSTGPRPVELARSELGRLQTARIEWIQFIEQEKKH